MQFRISFHLHSKWKIFPQFLGSLNAMIQVIWIYWGSYVKTGSSNGLQFWQFDTLQLKYLKQLKMIVRFLRFLHTEPKPYSRRWVTWRHLETPTSSKRITRVNIWWTKHDLHCIRNSKGPILENLLSSCVVTAISTKCYRKSRVTTRHVGRSRDWYLNQWGWLRDIVCLS